MLNALALAVGGLLLVFTSASAQHVHGTAEKPKSEDSAAAVLRPEKHTLSAKAREQIASVESAVAALSTLDAARAAGFRSVFGVIPTMGVHWAHIARTLDAVKLLEPDNLMFSTVDDKPRLVGVAYAFLGPLADAPDLFEGEQDVWHEHPEFAIQGRPLVMLHVWFVPSPDGPFTGHNPWLAYWAAGVEPPADSLVSGPVSASRARRLALALAEATEPLSVAAQIQSGRSLLEMGIAQLRGGAQPQPTDSTSPPGMKARRDSLRAAIPRLNAARGAGDQARWAREADKAIEIWRQVRDAYIEATPPGEPRDRLAAFYQQMETGGHAH